MSAAHSFLSLLERLGLEPETPPGPDAWRALVDELSRDEPSADFETPPDDWYKQAVEISPNAVF